MMPQMQLTKVLVLSRYARRGPSSRIRTYQFLPFLAEAGFDVTVAPLLDDTYLTNRFGGRLPNPLAIIRAYLRRIAQLREARQFDLIWIEIELMPWLPPWFERWLLRLGIPMVVDYDDAWFHRYSQQPWWLVRRLLGPKINEIMRSATMIMAGNQYLADHAWAVGARDVRIVPTVVDTDRFLPAGTTETQRPQPSRPFTIGWIGSPASTGYLDRIRPVLTELVRNENNRLVLVGAADGWGTDLPAVLHPWSEDSEVDEVRNFDIGISPLTNGSVEQGKCGYKTLQYMACGLPVVVAPVGVHLDIVQSGTNGFFANSHDDWIDAIRILRDDPGRRVEMGRAARQLVEQSYSLKTWAPRLADLLCEAAGRPIMKIAA